MLKLKKEKEPTLYTSEQIERRKEEIPDTGSMPCFEKRGKKATLDFSEQTDGLNINKVTKPPIPPSIEYLSTKYERPKPVTLALSKSEEELAAERAFVNQGSKTTQAIKRSFGKELEEEAGFEFDHELISQEKLTVVPTDIAPESELSQVPLASPEKIKELNQEHMYLYSILVKIQEIHVASDFKAAYDIQDKISYLLTNPTLLFESLVDELIVYLKIINQKLENYKTEINKKQMRFAEFNSKVSKLKEYKYKTDNSFKLLDDNKDVVNYEIDRNLKSLEDSTL